MTVSSTTTAIKYTGDGSTVNFTINYKYLAKTDIVATIKNTDTLVETIWVLDTDYTLTAAGDSGTLTATTAPASNEQLTISRETVLTQGTDYVENDPFPAESHEAALDRLTMIAQENGARLDRAITIPVTSTADENIVQDPADRPNYYVAVKSDGSGFELVAPAAALTNASVVRESFTASAAQTVFTLVSAYSLAINHLQVFVNGVRQTVDSAYTETGVNTVTFSEGLSLGDQVDFYIGILGSTTSGDANNVTHTDAESNVTNVGDELRSHELALVNNGRKNWIINGDMQVSQRGDYATSAVAVADGAWTLDRWQAKENLTANPTVQQTSVTVGGETVSALKASIVTGQATTHLYMRHPIEDYSHLAGKVVTMSADVRSNTSDCIVHFYQGATGGWSSASVNHTGNGVFEKLQKTFTVASNADGFEVYISIAGSSSGANVTTVTGDYIEFTNVKLEIGDTATPFEVEPYAEVLRKCQRYYYKLGSGPVTCQFPMLGLGGGSNTAYIRYEYPVEMYSVPDLLTTGTAADYVLSYGSGSHTCTAVPGKATNPSTNKMMAINFTAAGLLTGGTPYQPQGASTSVYLAFEAEL